jgi:8-oxo-dGTP pyrophosphatase MutT (NUDIX family)
MPTTRARRATRVRDALAAGGVVLRGTGEEIEVVIAGRDSDRTWVFPKGTPDRGETIEETAIREVREESGLDVEIVRPIGAIDYWFAVPGERVHKIVHFFLMRSNGGDVSRHDHEYDDVRWVTVADARRLLTYDTYRDMLERAIAASKEAA